MLKLPKHLPHATELMDNPQISLLELAQMEEALNLINFLSGAFRRTAKWVKSEYRLWTKTHPHADFTFLDVGCGAGGLLRFLRDYAKKYDLKIKFFGIDINCSLLAIAEEKEQNDNESNYQPITYLLDKVENFITPHSLVFSNLVLHHLKPSEIKPFLLHTQNLAQQSVRHEDILRSRLGLMLNKVVPHLLTSSKIVRHDAQISLLRTYSKSEWTAIAQDCAYSMSLVFPQRVQLEQRIS